MKVLQRILATLVAAVMTLSVSSTAPTEQPTEEASPRQEIIAIDELRVAEPSPKSIGIRPSRTRTTPPETTPEVIISEIRYDESATMNTDDTPPIPDTDGGIETPEAICTHDWREPGWCMGEPPQRLYGPLQFCTDPSHNHEWCIPEGCIGLPPLPPENCHDWCPPEGCIGYPPLPLFGPSLFCLDDSHNHKWCTPEGCIGLPAFKDPNETEILVTSSSLLSSVVAIIPLEYHGPNGGLEIQETYLPTELHELFVDHGLNNVYVINDPAVGGPLILTAYSEDESYGISFVYQKNDAGDIVGSISGHFFPRNSGEYWIFVLHNLEAITDLIRFVTNPTENEAPIGAAIFQNET